MNASIFTLTAIAVDRYKAIIYPLSNHASKQRTKVSFNSNNAYTLLHFSVKIDESFKLVIFLSFVLDYPCGYMGRCNNTSNSSGSCIWGSDNGWINSSMFTKEYKSHRIYMVRYLSIGYIIMSKVMFIKKLLFQEIMQR